MAFLRSHLQLGYAYSTFNPRRAVDIVRYGDRGLGSSFVMRVTPESLPIYNDLTLQGTDIGYHGRSFESTMPLILTGMLFASESHCLSLSMYLFFLII